MKIKCICMLCISLLPLTVIASADDSVTAARMKRLDTNGNGTFEKQEGLRQWNRLRKLDTNKDEVITLKELALDKRRYLETSGQQERDIVYKQIGKKKLALDLYYPTKNDSESRPVIIYTHGGGWAAGSKQGAAGGLFAAVFKQLLDQGFCVASVDYRLYSKEGTVCMRDCVVDCKDAVRYLAKNRVELGIDSQQFYTFGDSAGGHLSQMLLLSSPESFPGEKLLAGQAFTMVAGVSWYGPCDFEDSELFNHDDRADFRDRFGPRILPQDAKPEDKLKLYREMSPVNYLKQHSPALLMIQGDKDTTIPVKHAHHIQKEATSTGADVDVLIVKNAGHNWRKVGSEIHPSRDEIVERTVEFFVKHAEK